MIMESIERAESGNPRYRNGDVSLCQAMEIANSSKMNGFKLYYSDGMTFYKEYALFDGKYREVVK